MLNVTMTLVNATSETLYPGKVNWFTSPPKSIAPGESAAVTLMPPIGSQYVQATLSLYTDSSKSGTPFKIAVTLSGAAPPVVQTTAPDNFVFGYNVGGTKSGQVVTATAYPGLVVDKAAHGYAIDLTDTPMKYADTYPYVFADLINAAFDPKVRSAAVIAAAGTSITDRWGADEAPPVFYADFTGGQFGRIVGMLKDYWLNGGPAACPAPDQILITQFKAFVVNQKQRLWVPLLNVKSAGPPQVFNLTGYVGFDFIASDAGDWDQNTVDRFLALVVSGAHVVQICAQQDMATINKSYSAKADFFDYFANAQIVRGNDLGSSHYVDSSVEWNNAGWYFLDINGETMPPKVIAQSGGAALNAGLLDAFMVGVTVNNWDGSSTPGQYNAFFQSEGWQQQGVGGGDRHMDDKSASDQTAWNIGTLGASPYSEKRGSSVFLAPDGWTPQVTTITDMMPYVGAYAKKDGDGYKPQPWLKTELVHADDPVDLDTSKYVVS